MHTTIGTFNLNNLYARIRFDRAAASRPAVAVHPKSPADTRILAARIRTLGIDVLAVQEVEDLSVLRRFNRDDLGGLYDYQALIEGNDPRRIDLGVLSRLPIGAITSHQTAVHRALPERRIFSRDLLEVDIWNHQRNRKLFTLFINHLKSHYVHPGENHVAGAARVNRLRARQAETAAAIIARRTRPDGRYVVVGDMNDAPHSPHIRGLVDAPELGLVNALSRAQETRPAKRETLGRGPTQAAWTYRYKPAGRPPQHMLFDQIWLSRALAHRQTGAWIDRRRHHRGDGSDHDPAWVRLSL